MFTPYTDPNDENNEDDARNAPSEPAQPVDPKLADAAIARIRKQVQGNGLKPSSIELKNIEGQIYTFFGTTSVHFTPKVQETMRPGRHSDGQIIDPSQIQGTIQEFITKISGDRGVLQLVHETILNRPDHGFGLIGEKITLQQVARSFNAHEACDTCRGTGGQPCHNCHGQERVNCYRCHAQGGVTCVTCAGQGQTHTPQGPMICHACQGRGLSACPVCQGQRMILCPECQGKGRKLCNACQGQGWTTRTWSVALDAETSFSMRTNKLPTSLSSLIERVGPARLAGDHHAQIEPLMGRDAEAYAQHIETSAGAQLWFLYRARIPFAELEISFGKTHIRPKLAGYKARLTDVPDFMDALLKNGANDLANAAQGGAGASQLILAAAKYRAIGDTLRGLLRMSKKQVGNALTGAYRLGLSNIFAKNLINNAAQALSKLSLWPRMIALGTSLVFAALFCAAFYIYDGRDTMIESLNLKALPSYLSYGVDIFFAALLGMGGTYAIRSAARKSLRHIMENLGVSSGRKLPLPKPGLPGLWLWIGVVTMVLGFLLLT